MSLSDALSADKTVTTGYTKNDCDLYLKNKYIERCTPEKGSDVYFEGYLTPKGEAFEADNLARGLQYNGNPASPVDDSGEIIVTARRQFIDGVPVIPTDATGGNGDSSSATTGLTIPAGMTSRNGGSTNYSGTDSDNSLTIPASTDPIVSASDSVDRITSRYDLECRPQLESTQRCCQHPEQCLGNNGAGNSAILGSIQAVMASAGQAASLSGACGRMRDVALSAAAINSALAAKCVSQINQCKQSCREIIDQARTMYSDCQRTTGGCTSSTRSRLAEISNSSNSCESNEAYAQQQANQTIASGLTAKTMDLCKQSTSSQTTAASNSASTRSNLLNCLDPSNASNPSCQNSCNRAGSQNDPLCNPSLANNGFSSSSTGLVDPNGKNKNLAGTDSLDEIESNQAALTDTIAPAASKTASSAGGGGSANLGGDPESPVGLNSLAGAQGGYDASALNPKYVSSGVRTGNGYSSPSRSVASAKEESSFFSLPFFGKKDDSQKAFNPKDYLPGGRLDPRRRLAGLSEAMGIGSVHGDIFKSITNRFYQVCLKDGLMDCESVRKIGPKTP